MESNYIGIPGLRRGATAVTQYRAVIQDTGAFRILPVTNANASRPMGILQNDPGATDEPADVAYVGVCKAEYGGTVAVGDALACNNSGQLITDVEVTDGTSVDLHHIAIALEAGSSGEMHYVLLHPADRIGLE